MDKFEAACIEYAEAREQVLRLGKEIGNHRDACYSTQVKPGMEETQQYINHLENAYKLTHDQDDWGRTTTVFDFHDGDAGVYLAGICQHCLAAHIAIQERKEARKRFGIAKRRISVMGRTAAVKSISGQSGGGE